MWRVDNARIADGLFGVDGEVQSDTPIADLNPERSVLFIWILVGSPAGAVADSQPKYFSSWKIFIQTLLPLLFEGLCSRLKQLETVPCA